MGISYNLSVNSFISTLFIVVLLAQRGNAGVYSCWGGCLNQCVLLDEKKTDARIPCYWDCLNKCFPQSPRTGSPGSSKPPSEFTSMSQSTSASEIPSETPESSTSDDSHEHVSRQSMFPISMGRKFCMIGCSLQSCLMPGPGTFIYLLINIYTFLEQH